MKSSTLAALGVVAFSAIAAGPVSAQLSLASGPVPLRSIVASTPSLAAAFPTAEVRVFNASQHLSRSNGSLTNGTVVSLCVTSSTGRFRLRVMSETRGGLTATHSRDILSYSVLFRDPTGAETAIPMTDGEILFEGRSRGEAACSTGANATITVRSLDREISRVVAGEYFESIVLSADPL